MAAAKFSCPVATFLCAQLQGGCLFNPVGVVKIFPINTEKAARDAIRSALEKKHLSSTKPKLNAIKRRAAELVNYEYSKDKEWVKFWSNNTKECLGHLFLVDGAEKALVGEEDAGAEKMSAASPSCAGSVEPERVEQSSDAFNSYVRTRPALIMASLLAAPTTYQEENVTAAKRQGEDFEATKATKRLKVPTDPALLILYETFNRQMEAARATFAKMIDASPPSLAGFEKAVEATAT
ncbi:hypothetical protein HDU87_006600 [Geranomyces variabilis]|uniref:Uncharacterized protein n=1 Tax=Geranomyces variabilis TaxID=109894 RepID=A0AAD5XQE7_9FUNG|nr:hypothetical protein HDU87_006600 [Geranomyces variabilis]